MDLEVVKNSSHCPYIIKFYGALFKEVSTPSCECNKVVSDIWAKLSFLLIWKLQVKIQIQDLFQVSNIDT